MDRNQDKLKKIAIVTGASGGIGKAFVEQLMKEDLDEIWIVGRSKERLGMIKEYYGEKIICLCKDLTDRQDLLSMRDLLQYQQVSVSYLINNAGMAQMKASLDFDISEIEQTIKLNCQVPVILCHECVPFMTKGSHILNISSASAFQPVPYINLYASTKAFEKSYSQALHEELKILGISVTAVCPSWVDTKMLMREINGKQVKFPGIVSPQKVAKKAIKDAKKGKTISICSLYVKCQYLNVKFMPQKWINELWMRSLRKYQ
ncbi:SDR family NAD(P)-dependent oxidoreductase [Candidatus Stoquefichus massiliensis]|uniref:SDR family NAD(P)-dependent oxidoreductase n=1 Tax=Candidatus Stoquefichus massiliensis TaxID=1470350 RepID=UPI000481350B|nr:SDR family NAD(P)-dependent oxidoreductase [Candidatus Stoquefichus massiliensis]